MTSLLRWLVIVLAVAGIALDGATVIGGFGPAHIGIVLAGRSMHVTAAPRTVVSVEGGSPAQRAGIRVGDRLRPAQPSDARVFIEGVNGTTVHFRRADGSVVAVTFEPVTAGLRYRLVFAFAMLIGVLALVLAARAWSDPQARRLAVGLVWVPWLFAGLGYAGWPNTVIVLVTDVAQSFGLGALMLYGVGWNATRPRIAAGVRALVPVAVLLLLAVNLTYDIAADAGFGARLGALTAILSALGTILFVGELVITIAALAIALFDARGLERRRLGWIFVSVVVTFVPWMAVVTLQSFSVVYLFPTWVAVTSFALPIGFAYAMLRLRVIDLGFALNRAAVFAATTTLIVGLFGALQWAADQLVLTMTHAGGIAVQMGVVVVVLYLVRALRARTDALVNRMFFAARRRRIEAIARLAREIDAVTTASALPPFVVERLAESASIDAAVFVETGDGFERVAGAVGPVRVAADAAPVVALRASVGPTPLHLGGGRLDAIAFPLAVRGRLRGALVCALPSDDEVFAPDESEALERLATRLAIARDDLLAETLRAANDVLARRVVVLERENTLLQHAAGLASEPAARRNFADAG